VSVQDRDTDTARRNRRTALILAAVALAFMIGFMINIWLK